MVTTLDLSAGASRASIVKGDLVVAYNGFDVNSMDDLNRLSTRAIAGDIVELSLRRVVDGRVEVVPVEIAPTQNFSVGEVRALREKLGLPVSSAKWLTKKDFENLFSKLKPLVGLRIVDGEGAGVVVQAVAKGSPAGRKGSTYLIKI